MVIRCADYKTAAQTINGRSVKGFAVYSAASREVSFAGTFDYLGLTAFLEIDGQNYFQPMRYSRGDCSHRRISRGEFPSARIPTSHR